MPATVQIPKKNLEEILKAERLFVAAEDALENTLRTSDPAFLKKTRRLRAEHLRSRTGDWNALKMKHGV